MTQKHAADRHDDIDHDLDKDSLAAIRSLLQDEPAAEKAPETQSTKQRRERFSPLPPQPGDAPEKTKAVKSRTPKANARKGTGTPKVGLAPRIKSYRPTPKHILLFSLALLIYFRPLLITGFLVIGIMLTIGIFLILGYDGFWRQAMSIARWYARRRPARAAELHRKLDAFAMRWDAILDRFPEGTVDGLYLPDFGAVEAADARHDAALDRRLAQMQEQNH